MFVIHIVCQSLQSVVGNRVWKAYSDSINAYGISEYFVRRMMGPGCLGCYMDSCATCIFTSSASQTGKKDKPCWFLFTVSGEESGRQYIWPAFDLYLEWGELLTVFLSTSYENKTHMMSLTTRALCNSLNSDPAYSDQPLFFGGSILLTICGICWPF